MLKAPRKWSFSSGAVETEWSWFFPAFYFVPLSWGEYDFGQRKSLAKNGTPSLIGSRSGPVMNFDGTGDYFLHPSRGGTGNLLDEWSVTCYFQTTSTDQLAILGVFNTGTNTGWQVQLNTNENDSNIAGEMMVFMREEGGGPLEAGITFPESNLSDGTPHIVTMMGKKSLGSSGGITIYYELDRTSGAKTLTYNNTDAGSNFADFGFDLAFGARNVRDVVGREFNGQIFYIVVHNRLLSESEVRKLHRDPFGPFRMVDEVGDVILPPVIVAAADSIIPIIRRRRK